MRYCAVVNFDYNVTSFRMCHQCGWIKMCSLRSLHLLPVFMSITGFGTLFSGKVNLTISYTTKDYICLQVTYDSKLR